MRRLTVVRWISVIMGVTAGMVLCELALRIHNPFESRVKGNRIILPANEHYIMRNPDASKTDSVIHHRKNGLGFRGPSRPVDWESALTIIAVGGSTTECFYLSDGSTWPDRMSEALRPVLPRIWVNNAGLDGHSTFGHRILLQDHIGRLRPDIVLFLVGINDVGRDDLGEFDRAHLKRLETSSPARVLASLADYSELLAAGLNGYRYWKARRAGLAPGTTLGAVPREIDMKRLEHLRTDDRTRPTLLAAHAARNLPGYEQRVRALVRISREWGIRPVLVTQPALFGDVTDDASGVSLATVMVGELDGTKVDGATKWAILESYNDVTRRVAGDERVPLVDLAAQLPKSSRYYYDLVHFNNAGARAVGDIMAAALVRAIEKHAL